MAGAAGVDAPDREKQAMTDTLGQVTLNPLEDLKISLITIRGEPHVELRVWARAAPGDASGLPAGRAIALPLSLFPDLVRVMTEAQVALATRRRTFPTISPRAAAPPGRTDSRKDPRVHLSLPVECRLLDPTTFWPGKWVSGEIMDLSMGGAQVWLPECFPCYKQIEVFWRIEGTAFRGRAEIVGADPMRTAPRNGRYRHSLRWVGMDPHVRSALTRLVPLTIG
jgi:hypothetical protein